MPQDAQTVPQPVKLDAKTAKAEAIRLQLAGKVRPAEMLYRKLIAAKAGDHDIFNNLGIICLTSERRKEAIACFREAVRLKPDFPEGYNGLGNALSEDEPDLAERAYREALRLKPVFHTAKYNFGNLCWRFGRVEEAVAAFKAALEDKPDYVECRFNMSMAMLLAGDLEGGFREYETRLERKDYRSALHMPWGKRRWNGDCATRDTVVMIPEPGFGDIFHYLRYGKLLRQRGVRVALQARTALKPLLDTSDCYDEFIPWQDEFDESTHVWCPMFSLPYLLKTTLATIPADTPYLFAQPGLTARWKERLPKDTFRIAINWQGNPHHEKTMNRGRSVPLEQFRPLADVPGVSLVSLQKSYGVEQLEACSFKDRILRFSEEDYPSEPAFLEAAALIDAVDLVITSDTSIAHLAGAMGKPVWVALTHVAEWRWLRERSDSPWYPGMRLIRQPAFDDWASVFRSMQADLQALLQARARQTTLF